MYNQYILSAASRTTLKLIKRLDSTVLVSEKSDVNVVNTQCYNVTFKSSYSVPSNSHSQLIFYPLKIQQIIKNSDIFEDMGHPPVKHNIILLRDAIPIIAASHKIPSGLENS